MAEEKEEGIEGYFNIYAKITNASGKKLHFYCCCKGTNKNPSGLDTKGKPIKKGQLTHGELVGHDDTIDGNGRGTFCAKSVGWGIMGTIHYSFDGSKTDYWVYFHVPSMRRDHKESDGVGYQPIDDKSHSVSVSYTFRAL